MSYFPNYYSLHDIAVTQEKIPCQSLTVQKKMGFLDSGSDSEDLKQQSIDMPLWYCLAIEGSKSATFKMNIPDIYKDTYTEICKADAKVLDLNRLNKYFYEFGRYVSKFDRHGNVAQMIFEACKSRMQHLKDLCCGDKLSDVKSSHGLEFLEHELYLVGNSTTEKFNKWLQDETASSNIEASQMVVNHRKRKRENREEDDIL
ncbi:DNA replication complex GINS protein PSF3 [Culicoides brevitarsis]|uniref:DNA replication complex GINS protein PSF3 n=1 Tax=Culicoides brevitarsis TaxID=469753 RepID=UPI00307B9C1B